jgi:hypothetical protein
MSCRDAIHRVRIVPAVVMEDAMNRVPTITQGWRAKKVKRGKRMRTYHSRLIRFRRLSPRAVRIGLVALGLILLLDIFTAHFSAQVQSALTLPRAVFNTSGLQVPAMKPAATTGASSSTGKTAAPTPVVTTTATTTTSLPPATVLARDTFQRPDQQFWGVASDGQSWAGDAAKAPAFAIVNHTGQVTGSSSAIYDSVLGKPVTDSEVLLSGSINHFAAANMGVLLRWTDGNNLYKVFIDGTNLTAIKKVNGVVSSLQSVPFMAKDGTSYSLRVRVVGTSIMARAWQTGQAESPNWMLIATDNALTSGYDGLRLIVQTGITITVTSFVESKV